MRRLLSPLTLLLLALLALCAPAQASSPVVVPVSVGATATDTGVTLGVGQQAIITIDGFAACQSEGTNYPCGDFDASGAPEDCDFYGVGNCPAPKLPAWAVVGKVGTSGAWRTVGTGPTTIVGPGRVFLQWNDDGFDNFGEFTATIEVSDLGTASITSITGTPKSVAPRASLIPISALPANPVQKQSGTVANAPLRSSPLRSSPLRSSPLRSSPLRSSPLRSSALGKLSLSEIPLRSSSWDALLAGTPLDVPPATLTLDQVLSLDPLPAGLSELTLADLDLTSTPLRSSSLAEVLLAGATLAELAAPTARGWCFYFFTQDCNLSELSLTDLINRIDPADVGRIPLGAAPTDLSGTVLGAIAISDLDLVGTPLAGRTDLAQFATVNDLVSALPLPGLDELTLGQLLPALVAKADLPLEVVALKDLLNAAPRQSTGLLRYAIDVRALCTTTSLTLGVRLPELARYVPGTAKVGSTSLLDPPSVTGGNLDFDLQAALAAACGSAAEETLTVTFEVEPPARLGVPTIDAIVRADGLPYALQGPSDARVDDANDPGNTPATATPIAADTLRTGYIAATDDVDAFRFDAPPVGSKVTVTLSHLPADYDLSVTGPAIGVPSAPLRSSPLRSSPLRSSTIGDSGDSRTSPVQPTTLQDIPLRSSELSSTPLRSSSISRGLSTESATFTVTPDDAGKAFTLRVTGYDGATSNDPYVLRVQVESPKAAPQCRAARSLPTGVAKGAFPSLPLAASTKTIFLINEQRLAQLYPSADISALRAQLAQLAARPEVAGAIVPVESDPANPTAGAYAAWDENPCSVTAANGVATAVRAVLGNVTQNLDELRHVVVVGGDAVIPQVRVPDLTTTANEAEEADALLFGGKDGAASRALRDGFLLTDDGYGDFDPEIGLGSAVYVPDVALGRLVETPADIAEQLTQYVGAGGSLSTDSAYVAGYDFLKDGSDAILAQLSGIPGIDASSAIDEQWSAADARTAMNRTAPGITSVNAHYDHYRALPAAAFNGLVPDLLQAGTVRPAAGSLLFTAGCHAGLSLTDADLPDAGSGDAARLQDWVQQVTTRAVYVANTTYGYGDTEVVAYSERLLALLAEGIASRQITSGQALMLAKQRYAAEQGTPGVYEQKSSMGLTYYGLPFFKIGASGGEGPAVLPSTPPAGTQVRSSAFEIEPDFVRHDVEGPRFWWSVGNEAPQATHDRPLQPRTVRDVTATDGLPVHGAIVEELTSRTEFNYEAVYSDPTIDLSANEPAEPLSERAGTIFPTWILRTTRGATSQGLRDQLVVVPGQFDQQYPLQQLHTRVAGQVLRSDSTDYDPPVIRSTDAVITREPTLDQDGEVVFSVKTPSPDVTRAFVLYRVSFFDPVWRKVELTRQGTSDLWSASGSFGVFDSWPSYVVQVVDSAGNVGVSTSKGAEYLAQPVSAASGPAFSTSPEVPSSGYAGGPVTVTLDAGRSSNATFQVSIDGGAPQPYTGPFTISTDGIHTVRFVGSDGSEGGTIVRIDRGAPAVSGVPASQPSAEGFYAGPVTVNWGCTDAVSGVNACPPSTTIATEGTGITVTSQPATDLAENSAAGTAGPFNVDMNAPAGTVTAGSTALRSGTLVPTTPVGGTTSVTGTATDSLAGIRAVQVTFTSTTAPVQTLVADATVSCAIADRRSCTWTATAPTAAGTWNVSALITDRAGRTTTVAATSPITTGGSTGGGDDDDDDDDDHGGGNPPKPPVCTAKVSVSVIVPIVVIVKGKAQIQLKKVTVTVVVAVPCCPKPATSKAAKQCATKNRRIAKKKARKQAKKIAKAALTKNKSPNSSTPSKRTR